LSKERLNALETSQKKLQEAYDKTEKEPSWYGVKRKLLGKLLEDINRQITDEPNPTEYAYTSIADILARTQKAKGLAEMKMLSSTLNNFGVSKADDFSIMPYELPDDLFEEGTIFARPAPMLPRHGFVESEPVVTYKSLLRMWDKVKQEDPDGEIILMKPLSGEFSAVATNAGVTWGMGNDGATDGTKRHSKPVFIPASSLKVYWHTYLPNISGITDTTYLELVQNYSTDRYRPTEWSVAVQMRDGPEQPTTKDYIPAEIKVGHVYRTSSYDDLLEWEKAVKRMDPKKAVVLAPSLSSHWAVHAIQAGITTVTSMKSVPLGSILKPTTTIPEITKAQYKELRALLNEWQNKDYLNGYDHDSAVRVANPMVATIHAMVQWDGASHLLRLRAFAVDALLRFLLAAVAGELRHFGSNGPGRSSQGGRSRRTRPEIYGFHPVRGSRGYVYAKYFHPVDYSSASKFLRNAAIDYGNGGWDSAYGGPAWANVAKATRRLALTLTKFQRKPGKETWSNVVAAANNALHTSHNNGVALTKWIARGYLTAIAEVPVLGFLSPTAGRVAMGLPMWVSPVATMPGTEEEEEPEERRERDIRIDKELNTVYTASMEKLKEWSDEFIIKKPSVGDPSNE
jgi:hypothetical protein